MAEAAPRPAARRPAARRPRLRPRRRLAAARRPARVRAVEPSRRAVPARRVQGPGRPLLLDVRLDRRRPATFLDAAFGAVGRDGRRPAMKRPRLSYNVAVYHRTFGGRPMTATRGPVRRARTRSGRLAAGGAVSPGVVFLAIALIGSVVFVAVRDHRPRRVADPAAGGRRRSSSGSSSSPSPPTRCARPGGPASTPATAAPLALGLGGGIAAIIGAGCIAGRDHPVPAVAAAPVA